MDSAYATFEHRFESGLRLRPELKLLLSYRQVLVNTVKLRRCWIASMRTHSIRLGHLFVRSRNLARLSARTESDRLFAADSDPHSFVR